MVSIPAAYSNGVGLPNSYKKNIYRNENLEQKFLYNLEHLRHSSQNKHRAQDRSLVDEEWITFKEKQEMLAKKYPKFVER